MQTKFIVMLLGALLGLLAACAPSATPHSRRGWQLGYAGNRWHLGACTLEKINLSPVASMGLLPGRCLSDVRAAGAGVY